MDLDLMFPKAMTALRRRLEENEPRKKGKWKKQGLQGNLRHLSGHFNNLSTRFNMDDLEGTAVRAIMSLEHALTPKGQ